LTISARQWKLISHRKCDFIVNEKGFLAEYFFKLRKALNSASNIDFIVQVPIKKSQWTKITEIDFKYLLDEKGKKSR